MTFSCYKVHVEEVKEPLYRPMILPWRLQLKNFYDYIVLNWSLKLFLAINCRESKLKNIVFQQEVKFQSLVESLQFSV